MNISGKTIVFKSEYGYSTAISNKKQDGTYDKMYLQLQLPKGVEVENKTFIEITKGFLSFYKDKNGIAKPKIVVMEINADTPTIKQEEIDGNDVFELTPEDLPF